MAGATLVRLGSIAEHRWGLVTTALAEDAGVSRKQLSRMASSGAIERVTQGVYRMAGAPPQDHEAIYTTWLALGGATAPRTDARVASIVAAGVTAAVLHDVGDFFLDGFDFIVPARKGTRLPGVRLRIRHLTRGEVIGVNGLPTLTIERTIADLVELRTGLSLVAGIVRDAVQAGKVVAPDRLVTYLDPLAVRRNDGRTHDGRSLANDLFELAGVCPEGWDWERRRDTIDAMTDDTAPVLESLRGPTGTRVAAHRSELLGVLRRHRVTNPRLFGSVARGDDHEGSDVDLLVDFAPGTSLFDIIGIQMELEEILGVAVDLVPEAGLKDRVRVRVERDLIAL